ncbi:jg11551 [Pararge aegeria aegeria]|uniref:Jg11551 protein n=1 Tax=Pararge aegeria aegeria TaxID=348720 RepID=A0A8S4RM39_9NEOP|nr:jg11551 [Pararge aegeria aegeria]
MGGGEAAARLRHLRQSAHRRLRCPTVGRTPLNNNAQKHNLTRQTQRRRSRRCSRIGRHAWPSASGPEEDLIYENRKRIIF